ncbi:conjugal transfer protein TraF [Elusimicrobiota bacterium]
MRKVNLLVVLLIAVAFIFPSIVFSAEAPVFIRGIRPLGMGGAFVALSDDQNAMFYNPAGITQRTGSQFTLFELPITIGNDTMEFYQFFSDNSDALENFDSAPNAEQIELLDEINNTVSKLRAKIMLGFPNLSYLTSGKGFLAWGLGVYSQADIGFQFNRSLIIPNISYWGNIDGLVAVPLAHKFDEVPYVPGSVSVGTTLKYLYRGNLSAYNKSILEFEEMSPQIQSGTGMGMDVGVLHQLNSRWNFGLQISDLGGTSISYDAVTASDPGEIDMAARTEMIRSEWNVGAAYIPSKIYFWPGKSINTKDRIRLMGDIRDILNTDERLFDTTVWKKIHLGAEFVVGSLALRGGYNSGYPSCGFGLRIPFVGLKCDYAYWTDEKGVYAGQVPESHHRLSLALSWGDQKGRAFGSDLEEPVEEPKAEEVPVVEEPAMVEAVEETIIPPAEEVAPPAETLTGETIEPVVPEEVVAETKVAEVVEKKTSTDKIKDAIKKTTK